MYDPRMILLDKAGNALYHWLMNSPSDTMTKAMGELGDAVQEAEALRTIKSQFRVEGWCVFRTLTTMKDKRIVYVWLIISEDGEPHICIENRILTKTPQFYNYTEILRRGNGYFYIANEQVIRYSDCSLLLRAFSEIKEVADPILAAFNKKEK